MKILQGFLLGVAEVLIGGLVAFILWGWFVVPLGAPQISFAHATGIAVLVTALTFQVSAVQESFLRQDPMTRVSRTVSFQLVGLAVGFVFHLFM